MQKPNQFNFRRFALLLAKIEANAFSGKVSCETEAQCCELYFKKGQLVHALSATQVGEDVIYDLLNWGGGTLTIEAGLHTSEHSIDSNQLTIFRETVKLFQARGIFDANGTAIQTPSDPGNNPAARTEQLSAMPGSPNPASVQPKMLKPPQEEIAALRPVIIQEEVPVLTIEEMPIAIPPTPKVTALGPVSGPPSANTPAETEPTSLFHSISKPVEWQSEFKALPVTAPKGATRSVKLAPIAAFEMPSELQEPVALNMAKQASLPSKNSPTITEIATVKAGVDWQNDNLFSQCLPPGRQARPSLQLSGLVLAEVVRKAAEGWSDAYMLVTSKDAAGTHFGLLILEKGQLSTVRYTRGKEILKGQAAFDKLAAVASKATSEVSIYESELKLLDCYRTLLGGNYLVKDARAHTLDIKALVEEQIKQKNTVAFRLYTEQILVFYLIYQGEIMGSYQVQNNTMERGKDISPLLRDTAVRLDLLEGVAPERIELEPAQMLLPSQMTTLVEAATCILQFLGTISGQQKVLDSVRKVLEGAVSLFPCLQRLTVGQKDERIALNWTLDQTQAFVTRTEAQTAFNFLVAAMLTQHNDLLGQETLRELARRALQNNRIDLKKEQLLFNCLA